MSYFQIMILALIQGMAELLPISSTAHVILAERLMGLDPSKPELTFLLVMLHTGTMFAVLLYLRRVGSPCCSRRPFSRTALAGRSCGSIL